MFVACLISFLQLPTISIELNGNFKAITCSRNANVCIFKCKNKLVEHKIN